MNQNTSTFKFSRDRKFAWFDKEKKNLTSSSCCCIPHVVIFFEQSIVFNCPLLELHIYTAAIDADDASDPTGRSEEMERKSNS